MAIEAANWINENCRTTKGGYLTNKTADKPLYLSDTLGMARAMLQLYRNTFEKKYLKYSCESLDFINQNFKNNYYGFYNKIAEENNNMQSCQIDENISLTRFIPNSVLNLDTNTLKGGPKNTVQYDVDNIVPNTSFRINARKIDGTLNSEDDSTLMWIII